jgi:hypothetical protein
MASLQPDIIGLSTGRPVWCAGIFFVLMPLMLAACEQLELAVTDSGQWGTVKSADAIAACTMTALGTDASVRTIKPNQAIEIRSNAQRAGTPMYIITVTRVDSGLTMVQLRAQDEKASRRAKTAAQSCIG